MRTHIKTVAVVNIILNSLRLLRAISVLVGGVLGSLFSGSLSTFLVGGTASVLVSLLMGAVAVFGLVAAVSLLNYRQWARYVTIVVAVFGLFTFPFGTIFSVYTLWTLLNDETKRIFEMAPVSAAL